MKYTINRTKRNIIILSSSFLILYVLILGFFFLFKGPTKLDTLQIGIQYILYVIQYGYLILVFVDYFRHYQLKVLQFTTITILIIEVVNRGIKFDNIFNATVTQSVLSTICSIWIIATIIWIIVLFQPKMKDYPAMLSIRKYAVGIVPFFVLGITIPYLVKPDNIFNALQLVDLTLTIPYIFTIDFAMKLHLKE